MLLTTLITSKTFLLLPLVASFSRFVHVSWSWVSLSCLQLCCTLRLISLCSLLAIPFCAFYFLLFSINSRVSAEIHTLFWRLRLFRICSSAVEVKMSFIAFHNSSVQVLQKLPSED